MYLGAVHVWMSKDNLWDGILSSYHVGPRDELSLSGCAAKFLYLLNYLVGLFVK